MQRLVSTGPTKRSRWEELRGTRGSKDSAWEKIRQDNARRQYNDKQQGQQRSESASDAYLMSSGSDGRSSGDAFSEEQRRSEDEQRRRMDKERARLEYEKMFEKESRGED